MNAQCQAALELALRGWHVFPCQSGGKRPMVDQWEQRATANPDHVRGAWTSRFPGANIGIACGPSRLVVLDLDTHGEMPPDWAQPGIIDGRDVFALLLEWAGEALPETYWVATPSGGWHFYFTAPDGDQIRNSAGKLGPLVDVRAAGGYVVGAGSVIDGKPYVLLTDTDPVSLPGWIARELTSPQVVTAVRTKSERSGDPGKRLTGLARTVEQAPEGQRNDALNWAAYQARELVIQGTDPDQVAGELIAAACMAGLPETEARRTIASGMGT
jgi:Bifunctional DNA primase/polymerase, N-terminal